MSKVITRKMLRRIIAEQARIEPIKGKSRKASPVGPPPAVTPPRRMAPPKIERKPDAQRLSDEVEEALSRPLKMICREVDKNNLEWGLRLHITISEDRDIDIEVAGKQSWSDSEANEIADKLADHTAAKRALDSVEPGLYKYVVKAISLPGPKA